MVVGMAHEQDATVGVEDRGVGPDLRALVAELAGETGAHFGLGQVERGFVAAGDDVEQTVALGLWHWDKIGLPVSA